MNHSMYGALLLFINIIFLLFCSACSKADTPEKIKDIEFTVCDESRLPKELLEIIEKKKDVPFRLSYTTGSYMYIVVGYGEQNRNNLSVAVMDLFLGEEGIYVDTSLISDSQQMQEGIVTYPYIALKCEKYEMPIIYLNGN